MFSIYSYPWAGLSPSNGDPQGYIGGKPSIDYAHLANLPLDSMTYNGSAQPTYFGALRNTFSYGNISLSFNISVKGGYYFRKPALSYVGLYNSWTGISDYSKRWQNPGDEKNTSIPSRVYPANPQRDAFYQFASVNVEKGDNIRLEDIALSYDIDQTIWRRIPVNAIRVYGYISNLGMIWSANKDRIDPYFVGIPKTGKRFSFGLDIHF
jgi:hypothetical protein